MPLAPIQYVRKEHIDVAKWDQCIDRAANGLVYAYSFYLDNMARNWDALVMGDYDVVMPLTWNRKFGISYLYQPAFTASLGIFGNALNEEIINRFIASIPTRYKLIEISLNFGNMLSSSLMFSARDNYILSLDSSYDTLYKSYRENIRRNIKKSNQLEARYEKDISIAPVIDLSKQQMQTFSKIKDDDYFRFEQLYKVLRKRNQAIACGVYLRDQLVASAVYFFSHNRAYYILVGNHPNGKTIGASHYLIDRFIHDHAGQNLTLDFEGSDIGNLAFFYSSFGAKLETYPALRVDKLPWWIKLLRK
jgi:hypothetical protein